MADGGLPADGPAQVGPVRLPAGRRITGQGRPVVWATDEPVPGAGLAWSALAGVHPQTHLVPILLSGLQGQPSRPWDDGEFLPPADITELDRMDAAGVLASGWADSMPGEEEQEDEDTQAWFAAALAPYGIRFPGLAPACSEQLDTARVRDTLAALEPARVGLVDAGRPADVLALIGWGGAVNRYQTPLPIAAVLRSWEARFAARLLEVGFADIRLLVERPPASTAAAQAVAAEHYALGDECGGHTGQALTTIAEIAPALINAPIWSFWWD